MPLTGLNVQTYEAARSGSAWTFQAARVRRGLGALPSAPGAGSGQVRDPTGTAVVGPSRLCQVSLLRIALHLQDYMSLLWKEGVKRVFIF